MRQIDRLHCCGCGVLLDVSSDSEAHIIPNALGGRLKPKGIICRACNTKLDVLADNALVAAFGDWPTLLDIPRDRGSNPDKLVGTKKGRKVRLKPDGSLTRADVVYEVKEVPEGHALTIGAGVTLPACSASHSRIKSAQEWRRHDENDAGALHA